ncbi:MAG: metallophosphoesterase [Polyangiaceae bacterium]|nr:metallophosphoesterase [Polyangiaceae bacterium]
MAILRVLAIPVLLLFVGACSDESDVSTSTTGTTTSASGSGGSAGASTSGSTSTSSSASAGGASTTGGAGGGGGGLGHSTLRFVALGDGGEGNPLQYKVAQAVKAVCEERGGCEFALYLGDNIYFSGVTGVDDIQFQTKFEMPYAILPFRFFVALGNHDYGGNGLGLEFWKAQAQVDYTFLSQKWTLPSRYYAFHTPDEAGAPNTVTAGFFAIDTNAILWLGDDDQRQWLKDEIAQSKGWKVAFGHHPYVSNGKHGVAGKYDGVAGNPVYSGDTIKSFMEDAVCGHIDVYICGHDHNREWLLPTCGTEFIVSGTAAKTAALANQGPLSFYKTDQKGGFLLVEMSEYSFLGTFYDEDGVPEFSRSFTK